MKTYGKHIKTYEKHMQVQDTQPSSPKSPGSTSWSLRYTSDDILDLSKWFQGARQVGFGSVLAPFQPSWLHAGLFLSLLASMLALIGPT